MARSKVAELPREVAQIVFYMDGCEVPQNVKYADFKLADKEFSKLLEAADHGKPIVLHGAASTCAVRYPQKITTAHLVMVDIVNTLNADTQKRFAALMAIPLPVPGAK